MNDIYTTLSHPKRRLILLDLFYEGERTINHFRNNRKIKTGSLYHHLNILLESNLIEQNTDKTYRLTPKGISSVQPLFVDKMDEFQRIVRNLYNPNEISPSLGIETKNKDSFQIKLIDKQINNFLSFLYNKPIFVATINLILLVSLMLSLVKMNVALIGTHFIQSKSIEFSLFSPFLTLTLNFLFIISFSRIFQRKEPITIEIIILVITNIAPISIVSLIITLFLNNLLFLGQLLLILEFVLQLIMLTWNYTLFRKIIGLDSIKSLLGCIALNYLWFLLIFLLF